MYATSQKQAWESGLSKTLGLQARIERVEEPRPGEFVLHNVALRDPDAPADSPPLLKANCLELASRSTGLVILASDVEATSEHLPRLWSVLHERLLRGPEVAAKPVFVSAPSVTFAGASQSSVLSDVRLQLVGTPTSARGALEFRLAGTSGEPVRMSIERDRAALPVATKWAINTGATPLPCSALAPCVPQLAALGDDCTFHGYLSAAVRDRNWQASLAGRFANLRLEGVVTQHQLTGLADIDINQAVWRDGKLAAASGQLSARGGEIGPSAWEAANRSFALSLSERLHTHKPIVYNELAFGFQLDEQMLAIAGRCANQPPDTVLADAGGPLAMGTRAPLDPIALVQFLVPDSDAYVVRQLMHTSPVRDIRISRQPE
jgi:hypothetical protein